MGVINIHVLTLLLCVSSEESMISRAFLIIESLISSKKQSSMKEPVTVIRENRDSLLESQDYSRLKQMSPSDTHGVWTKTSRFATICCLPRVLYVFGIKKPIEQQAWREKV